MNFARASLTLASILLSISSFAAEPYPTGLRKAVQPLLDKPLAGQTYIAAHTGATVTRLTDSAAGNALYDGAHYIKTDYSRIQAENADASKLLLYAVNDNGLMQYALANTDGSDMQFIELPAGNVADLENLHDETEARWHPTKPAIIRFIRGQNSYVGELRVYEYNWRTRRVRVLADLSGKLPASWGTGLYGMTHLEGEYSADGNRLVWSIENQQEQSVGYVAFDLRKGGVVLGTMDYDGRAHNNLSISPSGRYLAISSTDSTSYFPVDFSREHLIGAEAQHGDFCVTAQGNDCYITVAFDDQKDPDWGWVFSVDLETGERTPLLDVWTLGNTSMHFSGRGYDAKGWALMSTYNCHVGDPQQVATRLCSRNMLVELKRNPKVYTLNWNHASGETYYSEPHASMSRDAKHVYFNSDWMDKGGDVDVYRLDMDPTLFAGTEPYVPPVNPLPLTPITLLAPANNSRVDAEQQLLFSFEPHASQSAQLTYDVQLRSDSDGDNTVLFEQLQITPSDICLPTSCDIMVDAQTFASNSQYAWRVKASTGSTSSNWSEFSFGTLPGQANKPTAPTLLSPKNNAEFNLNKRLTFRWHAPETINSASAISHYALDIRDAQDNSTALAIDVPTTACAARLCSYTVANNFQLGEAKNHRWSLRAVNAAGKSPVVASRFALVAKNRVKPSTATLISPADKATVKAGKRLVLRWQSPKAPNPVSEVTHYDIVLYDRVKDQMLVNLKKLNTDALCDDTGLCTLNLRDARVSAGNRHHWRVRSINAAGSSAWSRSYFSAR